MAQFCKATSGEDVQKRGYLGSGTASCVLRAIVIHWLEHLRIHAGKGDSGADADDDDHRQREKDARAQIRDFKAVGECGNHNAVTTSLEKSEAAPNVRLTTGPHESVRRRR
jgi:hypothetical protein